MNYLFIGGIQDGKVMGVPDDQYEVQVFVKNLGETIRTVGSDQIITHRYYRTCINTKFKFFDFFCWNDLTVEDAIEKLFQNYRPL